ncbi:hypothetical protein [Massilia sp. YMA4]|uniref:hypothetical protein n=1 Tax=Massilia sp. YMA4 TaxID=1593482 RepID=UPI0015835B88|nr:hypothetical protein [Massilia sp. YMA4]
MIVFKHLPERWWPSPQDYPQKLCRRRDGAAVPLGLPDAAVNAPMPCPKTVHTVFFYSNQSLTATHNACAQYCPQFLCRSGSLSSRQGTARQFLTLARNLGRETFISEIKDLLSRYGHCQQFYQQFMCRTEHAPRHDLERGCNENAHSQNTQQYQALGCAARALLTILSTENVKKRTDGGLGSLAQI